MSYGRIGDTDKIKTERGVLSDLVWSPFNPSSNDQLIPIRKLEANKSLMKAQSDEKLSSEEKTKQVAALREQLAKLDEAEKMAEKSAFHGRAAQFIAADEAGKQDELKRMIADFATGFASTN